MLSDSSWLVLHSYRIEGPFTDLSGVTITQDAGFTCNAKCDVLESPVSVAANTLCISALGVYSNAVTPAFDNSFDNDVYDQAAADITMASARRLYTGAASDVQTTATWPQTGSITGNNALIRIAAPSGGGSSDDGLPPFFFFD